MTKRYIDADKLTDKLEELQFNAPVMTPVMKINNVIELVEDQPTADVVEVVRCSECKYKDDCARQMVHTTRDYVLEQNISTYNKVDFCSCGERRTDNEQIQSYGH